MPRITESGTRSPRSIYDLASRPRLVPSRTAARSTSPVAIFGIPSRFASLSACVPFPAPGGPSSTMIMKPGPGSVSAAGLSAAEAHPALLHEAVVLAEQQVLVDLRHRIESDTDHDEERRSAETEGHVDQIRDENRQTHYEGQEQRARESDARDHVIDVLGRLGARLHAG